MKRKFVKVMFFGALALSTVTYVGCKDYDDDVKGLQEQIDNINQKGADVTTEAMNAAINSAIAKVQADLDKIASKADKSALDELQGVVTRLQEAVNGKADASKLETLKAELEDAISKANAAIQPAVDQAKKDLEKKISELEEQLATADSKLQEQITNNLADLKSQLETLKGDVARDIAGLQAQLDDLSDLKGRVEKLEEIKHLTTADVLAFIKSDEEVKQYIDAEYVALLQQNLTNPESALLKYLNDTFTAQLMAKVETKCEGIVSAEMDKLRQEWEAYKTTQGEDYKKLDDRIVKLEEYKLDLMQQLYDKIISEKTLENLVDAISDIEDLTTKFSSYTTTAELNTLLETQKTGITTDLEKYTDDAITALDTKFSALETKISALRGELGNMLKSLVFLPQKFNDNGLIRNVYLTSIFTLKAGDKDPVLISGKDEFTVQFRVSPASAVADLVAGEKYKITTDNHVVTRSMGTPFSVKEGGVVATGEDGVIAVTLKAGSATESHAIALYVEGIDAATKLTQITSDYFGAVVDTKYLKDVKYSNASDERDSYGKQTNVLYSNGKNSLAFYTADAPENYALTLAEKNDGGGAQTTTDLGNKDLGLPADLFNVSFSLFAVENVPNDNDYFAWATDKTTLKISSKEGNLQKTCKVLSTVTVKAADNTKYTFEDATGETVTIKAEGAEITDIALEEKNWNLTQEAPYKLKAEDVAKIVSKISAATGISYTALSGITTDNENVSSITPTADKGVEVAINGNDVEITIPAAFEGTATPKIVFAFTNTVIVEVPIAVTVNTPKAADYSMTNEPAIWDGSSIVKMIATPNASAVSSVSLSANIAALFKVTEWKAIMDAVVAGKIQIKSVVMDANGKVDEANELGNVVLNTGAYTCTYTNKSTNSKNAKVAFDLYWTKAGEEQPLKRLAVVELTAPDMAGTITYNAKAVPATIALANKAKLGDVTNLQDKFKWTDSRSEQMWPTIEHADKFGVNTPIDALAIYGLRLEYTVDASSRQAFETYFDTTTGYTDGVLTEAAVQAIQLSSTYKNLDLAGGLASAITATINVKAISAWTGEIMSTKMTITYPVGTKK